MSSRLDHSREAKLEKRKKLEQAGVHPHPYTFAVTHTLAQARKNKGKPVAVAGRIISLREHGKVTFID
ncbi:MAG: lysine--tRNA ligase, partial [Patescibacteria group bacterium]